MWAFLKTVWRYGGGDTPPVDFAAGGFPLNAEKTHWLDTRGQWRDLETDPPTGLDRKFPTVFAALTALEQHR